MLAAVPYLIGIIAFLASSSFAYEYKDEFTKWIIGEQWQWLMISVEWISFLISILISGIFGILCMLLLGGFFIEMMIETALVKKGYELPEFSSVNILIRSTLRGLRDDVIRLIYIIVLIIVSFTCGFIPVLFFIPPVLAAFLVGFDLVDLPLTLLEFRFKDRWGLIKKHLVEVLAIGAVFSAIMLIPFGGILFLPIAYLVTVEQIVNWGLKEETTQ